MNKASKQPTLFIIGGPNGAGKSTVAEYLLSTENINSFVNADIIAKGLGSSTTSFVDIQAGRLLIKRLHKAIDENKDIAFESTMAGRSWKTLIQKVKQKNYNITLCYVAVENPDISISRVDKRVLEGGHFIPHDVINRRYERSLSHFFSLYKNLCDQWYFFDNSNDSAILLAYKENGDRIKILNKDLFKLYETKI